ncbi:MAG: type II toxin-antitoxin system YafQ family toxin [Candidatus Peregrinibacteria bacterium]
MFALRFTKAFERDVKRYERKGGDRTHLQYTIDLLQAGDPLPPALNDHQLHGTLRDCRELHVEHDWLLVYKKDGQALVITCLWLVSHKRLKEREQSR